MDTGAIRDSITDAIRYWEPRRLVYNAFLAIVVLVYFGLAYPHSRTVLSFDFVLSLILLAVLANVAYCAAYIVDVFAQISSYRDLWRQYRWILFCVGLLFSGILTRFFAIGMFSPCCN